MAVEPKPWRPRRRTKLIDRRPDQGRYHDGHRWRTGAAVGASRTPQWVDPADAHPSEPILADALAVLMRHFPGLEVREIQDMAEEIGPWGGRLPTDPVLFEWREDDDG